MKQISSQKLKQYKTKLKYNLSARLFHQARTDLVILQLKKNCT